MLNMQVVTRWRVPGSSSFRWELSKADATGLLARWRNRAEAPALAIQRLRPWCRWTHSGSWVPWYSETRVLPKARRTAIIFRRIHSFASDQAGPSLLRWSL